jgi:thiol-disulfide isomerase/thioredoxin
MTHKFLSKTIALASLWIVLISCAFLESFLPVAPNVDNSRISASTTAAMSELDYTWTDESPAPDSFTVIRIEPGPAKVKDILQAEAQKAAALGRRPYVEFYADWCPPCNAIKKNLGDPLMVEAFAGTYIIKLDTDVWGDKLSGLGIYVPGIPAFYELGADGKPTGRMITGTAWGEDIPANIAPPMKTFFEGN